MNHPLLPLPVIRAETARLAATLRELTRRTTSPSPAALEQALDDLDRVDLALAAHIRSNVQAML